MEFIFLTSVFVSFVISAWTYTVPDATVEIIKPKGFRLSIPDEEGITQVSYNLKIDQPVARYQPTDYAAVIKETTNGLWAYDNINTSVRPGNKINYSIHVQFGKIGRQLNRLGTVTVTADTEEISDVCTAAGVSTKQECPATTTPDCEQSVTTVRGRIACKGQLIFEDNFDSLNWTKWQQEVRIPLSADDGQFVSFQNLPGNCYVASSQLHIVPSLQSDSINVRIGKLDLTSACTAITDRPLACLRQANNFYILPPVISARIRTKYTFSFRYGKVEIKAKLPKGDWLFPLILLEPLENYYGMEGYASGQIRVAYNRGNAILVDQNSKDISSQWLHSGVVMKHFSVIDAHMKSERETTDLSSDFHIYTLTWGLDRFVASIDGRDYAVLDENYSQLQTIYHGKTNVRHRMAPFDREFFLALGLSAGGHSDFPDQCRTGPARTPKPWQNIDPKAELRFWNDKSNWYPTWDASSSGLHIDYVRVYAL